MLRFRNGLEPLRLLLGMWPRKFDFDSAEIVVLGRRLVLLNDPVTIREVLQNSIYKRGNIHNNALRLLLGNSILCDDGPDRNTFRKVAAAAINSRLFPQLQNLSNRRAEDYISRIGASGCLLTFESLRRLSAEIIVEYIFSSRSEEVIEPIFSAVSAAVDVVGSPSLSAVLDLPKWAKSRERRRIDTLVAEAKFAIRLELEARIGRSDEASDIAQTLVSRSDDIGLDRLVDELFGLVAAGFETTAAAIFQMASLLAENPSWQACIRHEFATTPAFSGEVPESFSCVWAETLRLYPPAYMMHRTVTSRHVTTKENFSPGTNILVCPLISHRNPSHWKSPHDFMPTRFHKASRSSGPNLAFIPFGAGAYACIGAKFAEAEAACLIRSILRAYSIRKEETSGLRLGATMRPDADAFVRVDPLV